MTGSAAAGGRARRRRRRRWHSLLLPPRRRGRQEGGRGEARAPALPVGAAPAAAGQYHHRLRWPPLRRRGGPVPPRAARPRRQEDGEAAHGDGAAVRDRRVGGPQVPALHAFRRGSTAGAMEGAGQRLVAEALDALVAQADEQLVLRRRVRRGLEEPLLLQELFLRLVGLLQLPAQEHQGARLSVRPVPRAAAILAPRHVAELPVQLRASARLDGFGGNRRRVRGGEAVVRPLRGLPQINGGDDRRGGGVRRRRRRRGAQRGAAAGDLPRAQLAAALPRDPRGVRRRAGDAFPLNPSTDLACTAAPAWRCDVHRTNFHVNVSKISSTRVERLSL